MPGAGVPRPIEGSWCVFCALAGIMATLSYPSAGWHGAQMMRPFQPRIEAGKNCGQDPCQPEGRGGLKQSTYRRAMSGWGEPTRLKDLSPFEAQKRLDQVPSAAFSSAQTERGEEDGHVDDPCQTAEEHAQHATQCKKLCSSCYLHAPPPGSVSLPDSHYMLVFCRSFIR